MSSYAIIELERSGEIDQVPIELDPEQQYVYGQSFHNTWSVLDAISKSNNWHPLSYFCVVENNEDNSSEHWYDPKLGLETVSGLLNKFISLIAQGAIVFLSDESQKYYPDLNDSVLSQDEIILRKAIRNDQLFSYAFWDLRAYELILRHALDNEERFRIYVS
jgi:hypothetical protein